jgi:hypothetical protein
MYLRVTQECPCPVCGRPDWCLLSRFGHSAICCRSESDTPRPQFSGWLHQIAPRDRKSPELIQARAAEYRPHDVQDFDDELRSLIERFDGTARSHAAAALNLHPDVFLRYPIGFDRSNDALAIPAMQHAEPTIIGIRFRRLNANGRMKWWSRIGSTAGLLLPLQAPDNTSPVLVAEGPSDTLAGSQLGLHSVGRWACALDDRQLKTLQSHVACVPNVEIVVVGDNDESGAGKRGAESAAAAICKHMPEACVKIVFPPRALKDLRQWVIEGCSASEVLDSAKEVTLAR